LDKFQARGLTQEQPNVISAPGIRELPLTLECRVIYSQLQDRNAMPDEINERFYPQDVDSSNPSNNRDYHITYYGEIVNAYILEEEDI
jgi:flavin reductase (DIM6/NTAB) family NADH-FMN oxidoreductase RutF